MSYCVAVTQTKDWQRRLTRLIAGEIRRRRRAGKLSAQQVADRCDRLGFPVPRSVVANLENGRRETLGVAELLMLAAALEVPPLDLLVPLGREPETEILPGVHVASWDAAQWVTGNRALKLDLEPHLHPGAGAYSLFADHHHQLKAALQQPPANLLDADRALREDYEDQGYDPEPFAEEGNEVAELLEERRELRRLEENRSLARSLLRLTRKQMRERGLEPPPLPRELADVDDREPG
jgi:transcriptional regulator with XRE-family HTH domain